MVLSALAVCLSWLIFLALLATVRGGTSFLCPKRQRNEAKKTLSKRRPISVHSVQFPFMGTPKARCSPEPPMFEPLLLANPDMNTLRHQRSRASTDARGQCGLTPSVVRYANKFEGWLSADSAGCPLGRFSHWWRSVSGPVFGEGGFHTSVALACTALFGFP